MGFHRVDKPAHIVSRRFGRAGHWLRIARIRALYSPSVFTLCVHTDRCAGMSHASFVQQLFLLSLSLSVWAMAEWKERRWKKANKLFFYVNGHCFLPPFSPRSFRLLVFFLLVFAIGEYLFECVVSLKRWFSYCWGFCWGGLLWEVCWRVESTVLNPHTLHSVQTVGNANCWGCN